MPKFIASAFHFADKVSTAVTTSHMSSVAANYYR